MRTVIEKIVHGGYGLTRTPTEGIVFVPYTLPGEEVEMELAHQIRNGATFGVVSKRYTSSPDRQTPPCPYFGSCGGCQMQHMNAAGQRAAKCSIIDDCLRRIAKIDYSGYAWSAPGEAFAYRNNFQLKVSSAGELGFYRMLSNEVVPIERCLLAGETVNRVIGILNETLAEGPHPSSCEVRITPDGDLYCGFSLPEGIDPVIVDRAAELIPGLKGLQVIQTAGSQVVKSWRGADRIKFELAGKKFTIGYDNFFQVNYQGMLAISALIRGMLDSIDDLPVSLLELYGGVGTFSILNFHDYFDFIVMMEENAGSTDNCLVNLEDNDIDNVSVWTVECGEGLRRIGAGDFESLLVFLDPPRPGLPPRVISKLKELKPRYIMALSCEPSTWSRDLALLLADYRIERMEVIDMFPQTAHLETLTLLKHIDNTGERKP